MTEQQERYAIYRRALNNALRVPGGAVLNFEYAARELRLSVSLGRRMMEAR